MNQTIQELMTQILLTVLQVNAEGRLHEFYNLSGHVSQLNVYFDPVGTDYQNLARELNNRAVYFDAKSHRYAAKKNRRTQEAEVKTALSELLKWARTHLAENQQKGEAA